jgi:hypothetical protein
MEASARFGTTQLALADARLALGIVNHLRYQALNRAFGTTREQANVLTAVVLLAGVDGMYEGAKRITGARLHVSPVDAILGAVALRDGALGLAGPSGREIPGFGTLIAFAMLGGLAAPRLRRAVASARAAQRRVRAAEARVRRERITRYTAARDRVRAE